MPISEIKWSNDLQMTPLKWKVSLYQSVKSKLTRKDVIPCERKVTYLLLIFKDYKDFLFIPTIKNYGGWKHDRSRTGGTRKMKFGRNIPQIYGIFDIENE